MFEVSNDGDCVLINVSGELDETTLPRFDDLLEVAARDDLASLTLDLRDCTYLNSSGISTIIRLSRKYPGDFEVVVRPTGAVHRVFDVCGFLRPETFVRVVPDGIVSAETDVA